MTKSRDTLVPVLRIRILDPVPFKPLDLGSRMGKKTGSGTNNLDHISKSLETIFWLKYLNSLARIRNGKNRIRDKYPGFATLPGTFSDQENHISE
jgi:hypothetical protein